MTATTVVQNGIDKPFYPKERNTVPAVYSAMLQQIMTEYHLGNWQDLDQDTIKWLYDPLRSTLIEAGKKSGG